jgi:hypothetical protein
VIEKGEKVGTLYLCTGNTNSSISLASTGVDTALWHHRLGHMSEKGMKILHKRNLLPYLKQIDLDFCEHCVYGKQKRVGFLRVDLTVEIMLVFFFPRRQPSFMREMYRGYG